VPGEALIPSADGPDFVVFPEMLRSWDYPLETRPMGIGERAQVLASLIAESRNIGLKVEV